MCAQTCARPSKNILFLSGLYRRYGNRTRSEAAAFRRLYCRWGIAPRPKESFFVFYLLLFICCSLFVALYLFFFIYRYLLYAPPEKLSTVLRGSLLFSEILRRFAPQDDKGGADYALSGRNDREMLQNKFFTVALQQEKKASPAGLPSLLFSLLVQVIIALLRGQGAPWPHRGSAYTVQCLYCSGYFLALTTRMTTYVAIIASPRQCSYCSVLILLGMLFGFDHADDHICRHYSLAEAALILFNAYTARDVFWL